MLKSAGFPCQNISASVRWDICREQFFLKYSSLLMTSRLKEVFDYAENPDKTIGKKYVDSDLFAALQYAADDKKTDERMTATKKRFGKTGGNVAYHGYQSFQTGRAFRRAESLKTIFPTITDFVKSPMPYLWNTEKAYLKTPPLRR